MIFRINNSAKTPVASYVGAGENDPEKLEAQEEINNRAAELQAEVAGAAASGELERDKEKRTLYIHRARGLFQDAKSKGVAVSGYHSPEQLVEDAAKQSPDYDKQHEETMQAAAMLSGGLAIGSLAAMYEDSSGEDAKDSASTGAKNLLPKAMQALLGAASMSDETEMPTGPSSDMQAEGFEKSDKDDVSDLMSYYRKKSEKK